jgi:hypothetical protein
MADEDQLPARTTDRLARAANALAMGLALATIASKVVARFTTTTD